MGTVKDDPRMDVARAGPPALLVGLRVRLGRALSEGLRQSEPNLGAIGLVGVIGFPLYYLVWGYWLPQPYESLLLRLIGAALFMPLLLIKFWPQKFRRLLPGYWLFSMLYALPFFFTFMLLQNDMSTVWAMSTMAGLFLLVVLVSDWLFVLLLFAVGTGLAWAAHLATGGTLSGLELYGEQLPIYLFLVVAGSVFNYRKNLVNQERQEAMLATSRTIAHELRTPLLGIRSGIGGMRRFLPRLLESYRHARSEGLPVPHIRETHLASLEDVLDRIEDEIDYSGTMIEMLLVNAGRHAVTPAEFEELSMSACVATALARYPFRSPAERALVRWEGGEDFVFRGAHLLIVHVIFNLLRNALYSVSEAGRGEVRLWLEDRRLHVRDTGTGIAPDALPLIFELFFSSRKAGTGTGIGLPFCRMAMEHHGGSIRCFSEYGQYTEFVLQFPQGAGVV